MSHAKRSVLLFWLFGLLFPVLWVGGLFLSGRALYQAFVAPKILAFETAAGVPIQEVIKQIQTGMSTQPGTTNNRVVFLILGVDSLKSRGDIPPLTDTIILLTLNLKNGDVSSYAVPRDLWLPELGTKLNSLYAFGLEKVAALRAESATLLPKEQLQNLTQVPIDHVIVISLETLGELVDLVGGVEIVVPESFTDPAFPRTDVDVTLEKDPTKLYRSVTFNAGTQIMTADRILEYVRSRHASGNQGSDTARSKRQQQVIEALLSKLRNPSLWSDPKQVGQLYAFYQNEFESQFPLVNLISIAKYLLPFTQKLRLNPTQASIYPDETQGVLYHPPLFVTKNEWSYLIRDLASFRLEVQEALGAW